jgi:hypothetical protein
MGGQHGSGQQGKRSAIDCEDKHEAEDAANNPN